MTDTKAAVFHEVTVIDGSARRRSWSADEKARIVAESLDPAVSVSAVAHRHGLNPNQLYGWRRQFREEAGRRMSARERFAESGEAAPMVAASVIEVVIGAITVRVGAGVEAAALKRVLRVVRALA
jgi:transposase